MKTTITPPFTVEATRFVVDGDHVVVEATGRNATPDGKTYNNNYCWVCRVADGKLQSLREYMDTELVTRTFGTDATQEAAEPGAAPAGELCR